MFAAAAFLVAPAAAPPVPASREIIPILRPAPPPSPAPAIAPRPTAPAPPRPAAPPPVATLPRPVLPAAPSRPGRDQVLAAVRAEWGTYDTRHQGRLGPLEFGTWVMRANGTTVQPPGARRDAPGVKPVTAMNVTASAFAKADANHDGGVTPEEFAAFLMTPR